jgi:hypothetical protein
VGREQPEAVTRAVVNDELTPMDLVMSVIEQIFVLSRDDAQTRREIRLPTWALFATFRSCT